MEKNWNWDLSPVFTCPQKAQDELEAVWYNAEDFAQLYRGKIAHMSVADFREVEKDYTHLKLATDNICNYAYIMASTEGTNIEIQGLKERMMDLCDKINKKMIFVDLEICSLDEDIYQKLCASSDYCHYWDNIRKFKPYQLSEDKEHIIKDYAFHARSWQRLYKKINAELIYKFRNKAYNEAEILGLLNHPNMRIRHQVGRIINTTLQKASDDITLIYNNLIKHKQVEDSLRGYESSVSKANLINGISDIAVEALTKAVFARYETTSHRYYKLKAKILNCKKLSYWDRNAPYPFADEKTFDWEQSWPQVHSVFRNFSPILGQIADKFTDKALIDVYPRRGKESGCYCQPMSKPYMPYILLNYTGYRSDVLAYAHELGHGIHETLTQEGVTLKTEHTTIEAEIASIFGEKLMFERLYEQETDDKARFVMLAKAIENQLNTIVRQIAFHLFETAAFNMREQKEISTDEINRLWCQIMQRSLGPAIDMSDAQYAWIYIYHFFDFPFYVYSYAASQCLVNSLFQIYQKGEIPNFTEKYINLLTNPNDEHYSLILRRDFNLDMEDPVLWLKGLDVVEEQISRLEKLSEKLR